MLKIKNTKGELQNARKVTMYKIKINKQNEYRDEYKIGAYDNSFLNVFYYDVIQNTHAQKFFKNQP